MRTCTFRSLPRRDDARGRLFLTSIWFEDHNNPRYAELLPRLSRLDAYLFHVRGGRVRRGLGYRALFRTRGLRYRIVLPPAARRYAGMFTLANDQIPRFPGPSVSDVDDPTFSPAEVAQLRHPNLKAYVVTAARAARRFESLGVEAPWHVIPQGISLGTVDTARAAEITAESAGEVVVGYMAGSMLSAGDRYGDNPLFNVDHLLDLWDEIHRRVPHARLWLIGRASERVLQRVRGRDDVRAFGRLPRAEALARTARFDVGLYPRTADQGIQAAKIAEYMGLGVPVVSYDYEVTENVREAGAGLLVDTAQGFVEAVTSLVRDPSLRRGLADAARAAGAELDWDVLARRYEESILDRYLPGR